MRLLISIIIFCWYYSPVHGGYVDVARVLLAMGVSIVEGLQDAVLKGFALGAVHAVQSHVLILWLLIDSCGLVIKVFGRQGLVGLSLLVVMVPLLLLLLLQVVHIRRR